MLPDWSVHLRHLYWTLRSLRQWDSAGRRKWYRRIADEKKRLIFTGVDSEQIRLVCRHLANPGNKNAELMLKAYSAQLVLDFGKVA